MRKSLHRAETWREESDKQVSVCASVCVCVVSRWRDVFAAGKTSISALVNLHAGHHVGMFERLENS